MGLKERRIRYEESVPGVRLRARDPRDYICGCPCRSDGWIR